MKGRFNPKSLKRLYSFDEIFMEMEVELKKRQQKVNILDFIPRVWFLFSWLNVITFSNKARGSWSGFMSDFHSKIIDDLQVKGKGQTEIWMIWTYR